MIRWSWKSLAAVLRAWELKSAVVTSQQLRNQVCMCLLTCMTMWSAIHIRQLEYQNKVHVIHREKLITAMNCIWKRCSCRYNRFYAVSTLVYCVHVPTSLNYILVYEMCSYLLYRKSRQCSIMILIWNKLAAKYLELYIILVPDDQIWFPYSRHDFKLKGQQGWSWDTKVWRDAFGLSGRQKEYVGCIINLMLSLYTSMAHFCPVVMITGMRSPW